MLRAQKLGQLATPGEGRQKEGLRAQSSENKKRGHKKDAIALRVKGSPAPTHTQKGETVGVN